MYKFFISFLIIGFFFPFFSQNITVEDIWKDYKFLSARVKGFRSMNDGVSYTKMSANQSIIKYSITNPEDTGTVLINGEYFAIRNLYIEEVIQRFIICLILLLKN